MNCDSVTKLIPLYYYGELTPDEEDQLDQHLHECAGCTRQMAQQRKLASALDERQLALPPMLLDECREDLMAAIVGGAPRQIKPAKGPWALFLDAMGSSFAGFGRLRQPVGALLLVFLGYMGARLSTPAGPVASSTPSDNVFSSVKAIKAGTDGRLQITLDETRRREITGSMQDDNIRDFVLAGARDEDAAMRVISVGLLKNLADKSTVLDSLLNSLANDPNDGVRLKALDAVRPVASNARVIKTLAQVLLTDANPAMRKGAIDLIVLRPDDSTVGVLQNVMQREDNSAIRLKASKILKDWNASIGTF